MKYINSSMRKYLVDLAARTPAPGGGSAAAFSAAMAAALLAMACQFSIGKERYKKFEGRAKKILKRALVLRQRLEKLFDEDIAAYRKKNLKAAINVPAQVCAVSCELIYLSQETLRRGNQNLSTDVFLGMLLAQSAAVSALFYVRTNLERWNKGTREYRMLLNRLNKSVVHVRRIVSHAEAYFGYTSGR